MSAPVVPRPAATVILLRDGPAGVEVFMVVRHRQIEFASGALVFPGGRVDPGDHALAEGSRSGPDRKAGPVGLDADHLALRVAGIREMFEECGVLLAHPRGTTGLIDAGRLRRISTRADFATTLGAEDLVLATELLTPFAHWITPPAMPKRFDTHFFLASAPADQLAVHDGSEFRRFRLDRASPCGGRGRRGAVEAGVPDPAQSSEARPMDHHGGGDRGGAGGPDRDGAADDDANRNRASDADTAGGGVRGDTFEATEPAAM